jgi:hypothetical protein
LFFHILTFSGFFPKTNYPRKFLVTGLSGGYSPIAYLYLCPFLQKEDIHLPPSQCAKTCPIRKVRSKRRKSHESKAKGVFSGSYSLASILECNQINLFTIRKQFKSE